MNLRRANHNAKHEDWKSSSFMLYLHCPWLKNINGNHKGGWKKD